MPKLIVPTPAVLVNSATYGQHLRAARGTKKAATLNDRLAAEAQKTTVINNTAKAVYAVLKPYTAGFREGQLWQAMLGRMRHCGLTDTDSLLHSLRGLEINRKYPFGRFLPLSMVKIEQGPVGQPNAIQLAANGMVRLPKNADGYRFALMPFCVDMAGNCVHHEQQCSPWLGATKNVPIPVFVFDPPAATASLIICLHLQCGSEGVANNNLAANGMVIAEVVRMEGEMCDVRCEM